MKPDPNDDYKRLEINRHKLGVIYALIYIVGIILGCVPCFITDSSLGFYAIAAFPCGLFVIFNLVGLYKVAMWEPLFLWPIGYVIYLLVAIPGIVTRYRFILIGFIILVLLNIGGCYVTYFR